MALIIHSSSSFLTKKPHLLLHAKPLLLSPAKPSLLSIKSQDSTTQPPKPTITSQPADDTSSTLKPSSSGLGFGSSSSSSSSSAKSIPDPASTKKKQKGRRERASVIRRSPVEKPGFVSPSPQEEAQSKEQGRNESAFLLAWLVLGSIILIEGIVLAASGLLPEEWDKFFVKYLYPSFTPTVFLFVAGTVVYGVTKYLQNEKLTGPNDRS
ncbi:protein LPA2 [Cornus florida]|uniref:protein LPA2 n=1 Tax=Cornus florida TaxID=4283 RepID=UPI00289F707E|nr:protein LPA2 [Cornus florida]